MTEQSNFFDGVGSVSAQGGGDKFFPGVYPDLEIKVVKVKEGFHGLRFIVETEVVSKPREREPGVAPTPVGATGSWGTRIDGKWGDIGLGEAKAFIGVCHGLSASETDELSEDEIKRRMREAISPEQPLAGIHVAAEIWRTTTKSGHPMIKAMWTALDGAPATFPPEGWTAHPDAPGYYYQGQEVISEADLRARA